MEIDLNRSIIVIDKPCNPTSFQVSDYIKKQLKLNKSSHFGTLDPKVTGVLPVALGRAVKLTGYFSKQDKEYVGIMRLHEEIELKKIEETIKNKFLGNIRQLPPVKSRVKRQEREREIKKFEILEHEGQNFLFHVECQAGTYIRKLVHDLGKELGINAHMTELRRVRASVFKEEQAVTLYQFQEAVKEYITGDEKKLKVMLIPIEIVSEIMPSIEIKEDVLKSIYNGKPLTNSMVNNFNGFKNNQEVAVMLNGRLIEIALAQIDSRDMGENKDAIVAKPLTVFN